MGVGAADGMALALVSSGVAVTLATITRRGIAIIICHLARCMWDTIGSSWRVMIII